MKVGDMVSWNSSGGRATGRITRIVRIWEDSPFSFKKTLDDN